MIIKINNILVPSPMIPVREWAEEKATEVILGTLDAVAHVLVDLSYSIALVGSGLCILFWVVGWDGGKKWVGILLLAYALITLLLGGV